MKLSRVITGLGVFLLVSVSAMGAAHVYNVFFGAPAINGKANVTSPETGAIILDTSDGTYYGNTGTPSSPTWAALSGNGGQRAGWSGFHDNDCQWVSANTGSFADPSADTSCTFTQISNNSFGTVTSADDGTTGNNLPGIVFTPASTGYYYVCAVIGDAPANQHFNTIQLTDGSSVVASQSAYFSPVSGTVLYPVSLCGIYNATSVSATTLKLQFQVDAGTHNFGADSIPNSHSIDWTIFRL